jgi:hypothetical protein
MPRPSIPKALFDPADDFDLHFLYSVWSNRQPWLRLHYHGIADVLYDMVTK